MHGPAGVAEVAAQLTEHRRDRERAQRFAVARVVALDGGHEADACDLHEVVARLAGVHVAVRKPTRQGQEAPDQLLQRALVVVSLDAVDQVALRELLEGDARRFLPDYGHFASDTRLPESRCAAGCALRLLRYEPPRVRDQDHVRVWQYQPSSRFRVSATPPRCT